MCVRNRGGIRSYIKAAQRVLGLFARRRGLVCASSWASGTLSPPLASGSSMISWLTEAISRGERRLGECWALGEASRARPGRGEAHRPDGTGPGGPSQGAFRSSAAAASPSCVPRGIGVNFGLFSAGTSLLRLISQSSKRSPPHLLQTCVMLFGGTIILSRTKSKRQGMVELQIWNKSADYEGLLCWFFFLI